MIPGDKIRILAEWLGGWPMHSWHNFNCVRCGQQYRHSRYRNFMDKDPCLSWNPWLRLEDAMMLVEGAAARNFWWTLSGPNAGWISCLNIGNTIVSRGSGATLAEAIADSVFCLAQAQRRKANA